MEQEQAGEELIEIDEEVEMRSWFDEDIETDEDDPPKCARGIYIGVARREVVYTLKYMIHFYKHSLVNTYITDSKKKRYRDVISESPKEIIWLIGLTLSILIFDFLARINVSNLPKGKEIIEKVVIKMIIKIIY